MLFYIILLSIINLKFKNNLVENRQIIIKQILFLNKQLKCTN
jgi:hypothetical protein